MAVMAANIGRYFFMGKYSIKFLENNSRMGVVTHLRRLYIRRHSIHKRYKYSAYSYLIFSVRLLGIQHTESQVSNFPILAGNRSIRWLSVDDFPDCINP